MKRLWIIAVVFTGLMISPVSAQSQLIESYYAYLGQADHYNSRGERLTSFWQIIRQDRANYHRFGIRDTGDETDMLFDNATNRGHLEKMLRENPLPPNAAAQIVNTETWVLVEVYGTSNSVNAIYVTLQ